jgi:hypothetical protein
MPSARGHDLPRGALEARAGPRGALFAASPREIVDTIPGEHEILGHDRILAPAGLGGLAFAQTAHSIEPLAIEVLPDFAAKLPPRRVRTPDRVLR